LQPRLRHLLNQDGIRHIRTKLYTSRTNGKAEAFIGILQREGLRPRLPIQHPSCQSALRLAALVQQPPTPRLTRSPTTDQPRLERV